MDFTLHNYVCYSYYSDEHLVLNVGNETETGPMYDFPSLLLTEDYPYSLYQFTLDSLGRRKKDYVLSKPRFTDDAFRFKICHQTSPNETFVLCNNRWEYYIANSDLVDIDAVATFDWPYLST